MAQPTPDLLLLERWMDTTKWLLDRTQRFPKRLRRTLTERVELLALQILEDLTAARYQRRKLKRLRTVDERLSRLRILIRLAHELHVLSGAQYGDAATRMDDAGRLLGGWIRSRADEGARSARA